VALFALFVLLQVMKNWQHSCQSSFISMRSYPPQYPHSSAPLNPPPSPLFCWFYATAMGCARGTESVKNPAKMGETRPWKGRGPHSAERASYTWAGWGLHQRGWWNDAWATTQPRLRRQLAWVLMVSWWNEGMRWKPTLFIVQKETKWKINNDLCRNWALQKTFKDSCCTGLCLHLKMFVCFQSDVWKQAVG